MDDGVVRSVLMSTLSVAGDSRLLLPLALATALSWRRRAPRAALAWCSALALACVAVAASKLAWLLFGIAIERVGFYGASGHSAVSAAVYPVVAYAIGLRTHPGLRWIAAFVGGLFAVAIAASRILLDLHSSVEVAVGLLVGATASAVVLLGWGHVLRTTKGEFAIAWLLAALIAAALFALGSPEALLQHAAGVLRG